MEELLTILNHFLTNPYSKVYLRELSRLIKISPFAVKKYSEVLLKEGLILDEKVANLRYFKANKDSIVFKQFKIANSVKKIIDSGLVEKIKENVPNLSSIVLFGSVAKGEDDKNSDVDLLIIGNSDHINFGGILDNEINEHIFSWQEWKKQRKNNQAFYNDIVHFGISLFGELPLIK